MVFNPDEYLNENYNNTFNPDEYLSGSKETKIKKPRTTEALALGFANGSNFGFQDEIEGVIGGVTRGAKFLAGRTGDKGFLDAIRTGYKTDRDASREYQKQVADEHPIADFIGVVGSAIPTIAGKGGLTLASMVKQGALGSYGSSNSSDIADQAVDTAIGGSVAGGLGVVGNGISKLPQALDRFKKNQTLKALGATRNDFTKMGENADTVAQFALDNGYINPLKNLTEKQMLVEKNLDSLGTQLQNTRKDLPAVSLPEVLAAVDKRASHLNPFDSLDSPHLNQINRIRDDLKIASGLNPAELEKKIVTQDLLREHVKYSSGTVVEDLTRAAPNKPSLDDVLLGRNRSLGDVTGINRSTINSGNSVDNLAGQVIGSKEKIINKLIPESRAFIDPLTGTQKEFTIGFKDLVDKKGKLGKEALDTFGNPNKSKQGLDIARSALRDIELNVAEKANPQYRQLLDDYSNSKMVEELLSKKASMGGNSAFGLLGGLGATAGAAAEGRVGGILGLTAGMPGVRTKVGETAALALNSKQTANVIKLLQQSKIDPKIAAYLLSRSFSN